jgi:hypothetical protein
MVVSDMFRVSASQYAEENGSLSNYAIILRSK